MLHPPDDSTLLNDFRDTRSEPAFTELVRRHLPLVFQVALRRLGSAALAEEAAQHAFSRLAAKVAAVARHPERLRAWLHRTAYFEASTLARKESRLSKLPVIPDHEPMNRPEIYDRLDEALNKLPELDRELVLRHCCGGEDYRQMAGVVGKSEAACQKRVERALARLAHGMGGARTTGVIVAAFAASSVKLPAAERAAAAALKQHAATSGAAGAISGAKVAACAALALAGGAAGWKRDKVPPPPPVIVRAAPAAATGTLSGPAANTAAIALAPRPARIARSLDDVLETILAGRLSPLVEFLPQASVADLRAIMAEDDIGDLSEGMGSFGTAHGLAARRWVELEPAAAFDYGLSRSSRLATRMLARWMEIDPKAAGDAFLALHPVDRRMLAQNMVQQNDEVAGRLAGVDPENAWAVENERHLYPDAATKAEDAEHLVAGLLDGKHQDEPDDNDAAEIGAAFSLLARQDRKMALRQAQLLPWPALRATTLVALGQPPASETLPPGDLRVHAVGSEIAELWKADPEAAVRKLRAAAAGPERDAMYEVIAGKVGSTDPWRLLELVAALEGPLGTFNLESALGYAGRNDPRRALAMLPDIVARFGTHQGIRGMADDVLAGWIEKDAVEAIHWAAEAGIWLNSADLSKSTAPPETLLNLCSDPDESVRAMARGALHQHVVTALADGTAKSLLDRMPPEAADDLLQWIAADAGGRGSYDEAMTIAAMASAEAREQEILPRMGFQALRNDADAAVQWLKTLPATERRIVIEGVERIVNNPQFGGADAAEIRRALQQVQP